MPATNNGVYLKMQLLPESERLLFRPHLITDLDDFCSDIQPVELAIRDVTPPKDGAAED